MRVSDIGLNTDTSKVPVLHLAMSLDIGGAETHIVGLVKSLSGKGWPVYVASFGGRRVGDLDVEGIRHFTVPLHSRSPLKMLESARAVSRLIDDLDIGLVHAHARIPAWIADKVCKRKRVPLVTTYHWTFVSGLFWNLVTKSGDLVISVSQDIKDYIVEQFGFDADIITVIPNGIDTDLYAPSTSEGIMKARTLFGISEDQRPVLVYASRMNRDLSDTAIAVIDAVELLLPKFPNIAIVVAGDGDCMGDVLERAREVNNGAGRQMVMCPGFVLDTVPLFEASDLVLGMSRVVLEGMSTGKPAIVTGPGGTFGPVTQEVLEALEDRNFTSRGAPEPTKPDILAQHIESLLLDPQRMKDLGALGRKIVMEAHSMDLVAGEVEKVYQKALTLPKP